VKIHKDHLEEALRRANSHGWPDTESYPEHCNGVELTPRWDYSGRGMFGKTCFGVVTDALGLTAFAIELEYLLNDENTSNLTETVISWWDLAKLMIVDDMATQKIYYFPGLTVEE
jgi:hypothetical protein